MNIRKHLLAAAALGLAVAAQAQSMPPAGFPHGERPPMAGDPLLPEAAPLPPFLHGLKLSDAQRDGVFNLLHGQAPRLRERLKAIRSAEEGLRALAAATPLDEAKARSLADAAGRAHAELALMRVQADSQIRALLTAEQRKQIDDRATRADGHGDADCGHPAPRF